MAKQVYVACDAQGLEAVRRVCSLPGFYAVANQRGQSVERELVSPCLTLYSPECVEGEFCEDEMRRPTPCAVPLGSATVDGL